MAKRGQPGVKTQRDAFAQLASQLRNAAVRPNINSYTPHEKQVAFHASPALKRGLFGGNRSGKTVAGVTEGIWRATGRHPYQRVKPPPTFGRVVAVDFLDGLEKIVKPEYARWIPPSELINGSWEDSYSKELRTLTLDNGSKIEFMSYEQEVAKFSGTSRDWIHFDEEPPKAIFNECWMRVIDVRGCVWMTMTPLEGMTWVYDDIYLRTNFDPLIEVFVVDITDNPYLNQGEISLLLSGLDEDERTARAHGKFVQIGGLIYKNFDAKLHVIDPMLPPKEWMVVAGMDHGINNPTAWLWVAISPDGNMVVFDEHYQSGEIISHHAAQVHLRNQNHDRIPDYYVGDPSIRNRDPITGTSILIEYVNHGIPIVLGNNDVAAGIGRVLELMKPRPPVGLPKMFVTQNCVNFIREHSRYRWKKWVVRKQDDRSNKPEEPLKKDDHTCDAFRYIVASRPEVDNGTEVPENRNHLGSSEPSNPYDSPIAEWSDSDSEQYDSVLGSDS